jgi:3-phenylpropionate/trans-cinnamate dioxygenase ferredoxin subunit
MAAERKMFNYTQQATENFKFVEVIPASELPNGERLFVEVADRPIVIFNSAEQFFAISDVCTHDDGPLGDGDLEGYNIVCPRHGAEFDVRTGKVMQMPAVVDIPAYPVQVREGNIFIGIPKE